MIVISSPSTGHSILGGRYSVTISQHHELSPDWDSRAFVFVGRLFRSVRVREGVPMTHDGAGRLHCLAPHSDTDMSPSRSAPGLDPRNTCGKWTCGHYSLLSALILYILEVQTEYYSVQKSSLTRSNIDHGD